MQSVNTQLLIITIIIIIIIIIIISYVFRLYKAAIYFFSLIFLKHTDR
jgi:hypothetical protein